MKILQVISSFPPAYAYGGPPRSAYNLSKALVSRGHDVTVFTTDALDEENRIEIGSGIEKMDGVEVHRFRNVSNTLSWKNYPLAPRMGMKLIPRMNEYDVVHTHEYRSFHTLFAHWGSKLSGVPHVLQPRGSLPRNEGSQIKKVFDALAGVDIVQSADRLIASSHVESGQFNGVVPNLNQGSVAHVPNAVSKSDYQNIPMNGEFREKYGIDSNQDLVLFLGRLHPRKGGDILVEAVSNLLGNRSGSLSLAFVGPDEGDRDRLEHLAENNSIGDQTIFTGPLYSDDKLSAYVDADLFVLPSKDEYESFGNVVIEAMACGTPAVATNVCGVAEWIEHDACYTVPPNVEGVASGVEAGLDTSYSPESIRRYVLQNFSWDAVAAETEAVYQEATR